VLLVLVLLPCQTHNRALSCLTFLPTVPRGTLVCTAAHGHSCCCWQAGLCRRNTAPSTVSLRVCVMLLFGRASA